jgi:hypothetical protein
MSEATSTPPRKLDRRRYSSKYCHSPESAGHKRSTRRKLAIALAFLAIGAGFGIFTFSVVYPSAETGILQPYYSSMQIDTAAPIDVFGVTVAQKTPTLASMIIVIDLVKSASARPEDGSILLHLPIGMTFYCDPTVYCRNRTSISPSAEIEPLRFKSGTATCIFFINAHNFSVNSDRINAYAAIPDIILHLTGQGSENPTMAVSFRIPSASSYDWSSPANERRASEVAWIESLTGGETPGRVIDGTNHTRQRTDANLTFLAGALIGVAGAALLISIQEAMHAFDRE